MLHTGHDLPAITKNDLFRFRSAQLLQLGSARPGVTRCGSCSPTSGSSRPTTACTEELRLGQRSVAHLVDRYDITPGPIRDLFVRYLQERKTSVDYTTLSGLAADIVGNFWADIEKHHPGIDTPPPCRRDHRLERTPSHGGRRQRRNPATAPAVATSCSTSAAVSPRPARLGPTKTPPSSPTRCPPRSPRRRDSDPTDANCTCGPRSTNESENASPPARDRRPSRTRTSPRPAPCARPPPRPCLDDLLTVDGRSYVREDLGTSKPPGVCCRAPSCRS